MVEAMHTYEHKTKKKSQEWFWEGLLKADKKLGRQWGKWKKIQTYQTCDDWQMKKWCSLGSKCRATKLFPKMLLALEMNKRDVKMNNPVYLGLSILNISKTAMYQYWYDYAKPNYGDKAKLYRYRQLHNSCKIWKCYWR